MRTPLLILFLGPLLFLVTLALGGTDALGQDAAGGGAKADWSLAEVLGVMGVLATWIGVIAAGLSFAANMGRLSMTIEHLGSDVRTHGSKIDALGTKMDVDVRALETRIDTDVRALGAKVDHDVRVLEARFGGEVRALTDKHDTLATQVTRLDALAGAGATRTKTNMG